MNSFPINRVVFWLLISLIVILLSALITLVVFFSNNRYTVSRQKIENTGVIFRKELALSDSQSEKVGNILAQYKNTTNPLVAEIRDHRLQMLDELAKESPDTIMLNRYMSEISELQKQMQKASLKQYTDLKKICTPEQCKRLSALYFELYGFQGQGKGAGKGQMHRYRGGRGN